MNRKELVDLIIKEKVIAILRGLEPEKTVKAIEVYHKVGIKFIEVTYNSSKALEIVKRFSQKEGLYIGIGTITNLDELEKALDAGAQYIITPTYSKQVVTECNRQDILVICGALSPTEIYSAWRAGADIIKVFPASTMGPNYIRSILGPLSQIKIIPVGGINIENAISYLETGVIALGIGKGLLYKDVNKKNDWEKQAKKIKKFLVTIKK